MPFVNRLQTVEGSETWPRMEVAAEERFRDGLTLAESGVGRMTGAIYLFGYVVEMLLKTAFFRVENVPYNTNLGQRGGPLDFARTLSIWQGRNLHDLRGWVDFLIDYRSLLGKPFDPGEAAQIRRHVLTVDAHWREWLRYKSSSATLLELNDVYDSVQWLRANHARFWT